MKFCQTHWDELRDAIKSRGIYHLVAKDGETAAENLAAEAVDGASAATFDPLMSAHWAISAYALRQMGLELLAGDHCPLCNLRGVPPSNWINGAADDALRYARELGLAPGVS